MHANGPHSGTSRDTRAVARIKRALAVTVRLLLAVALGVSAMLVPQTAALAASTGAITVTTTTPVVQEVSSTFEFNVSWSCSGVSGDDCVGLRIEIPITLDNPTLAAMEDMDSWGVVVTPPSPSAAAFTHTVVRTGSQLTLVLTATNTVIAGTQENILVAVRPHPSTGDGVGFTFGGAELSSPSFPTATSNAISAQVTAVDLEPVDKIFLGGALSASGTEMIATYQIVPNVRGVWDPTTNAWSPCVVQDNNRNRHDVAIAGTLRIVDQLPAGATFISASGGGIYDPIAHTIEWNDCSSHTELPYFVRVSYPAATSTADPAYQPTITNTLTRTFTDTAGRDQSSTDSVTHNNIPAPRLTPILGKCGQGRLTPEGEVSPGGQCSPWRFAPSYAFSGALGMHYYTIHASRVLAGDVVTITDWMPCLDNPVSTPAPTSEGFGSAAGCANPAETLTHIRFTTTPGTGSARALGFSSLTLYFDDGTSEVFDASNPISSLAPLPAFSGGRKAIGFQAVLNPIDVDGLVTAALETRLTPGADRTMNLHNRATIAVENSGDGYYFSGEAEGIGAVRQVIGGTSSSGVGVSGSGIRYATASFGTYALDPAVALPTYVQVLPPGYVVSGGALASISLSDAEGRSNRSHYDIEFVAEDLVAGTPALVRFTPIPGTPAVPANADEGWPYVSVSTTIARTWGNEFGSLQSQAFASVNGAPMIDRCLQYSPRVLNDPRDFDGDGLTTGDTGCLATGSRFFEPTSSAATGIVAKSVRDVASSNWLGANQTAVTPSGAAEYRIHWQNAGQPVLSDIVMYDLLPYVGDTGTTVSNSGARGSEFAPVFDGLTSTIPANVTVEYSASPNPCRPEVYPGLVGCANDWTSDVSVIGTSNVRALRIVLAGNWVAGSNAEIRFRMLVPTGSPSGTTAWNTIASRALVGGLPLVPAETARTGISMPADVIVGKTSPQSAAQQGVGQVLDYQITAGNTLSSAANGVRIVDDLTAMLNYADYNADATATVGGVARGTVSYDPVTHLLVWVGDLGVGESVSIDYTMTATAATPAGGARNSVTGRIGSINTNCVTGAEPECHVDMRIVSPRLAIDKFSATTVENSLIEGGTTVNWTYRVTNSGTEAIEQLVVTDSRGVVVTCPATTLAIGASMDCTGSGGVGNASPYSNTGIVSGRGVISGAAATASDTWTVRITPLVPAVTIVKSAVGVTEGSLLPAETVVNWRYTITNTGTDALEAIAVTDNRGVAVTCPATVLARGASMVCTGSGSVGLGTSYTNIGTVNGVGSFTATAVSDSDDWSVRVDPYDTGITIDKRAIGVVDGGRLRPNAVVTWEYEVTNVGQEPVASIVVTDDQGVVVTCPATTLAAGASMVCTGTGSVGAGPAYRNVGEVTGVTTLTSTPVDDDDEWTAVVRELAPSIAVVKGALNAVEGQPTPVQHVVNWQYTVVNNGEEALEDLVVTDDQGVAVSCPVTVLAIGASMTCTGSGSIGTGLSYTNLMEVTGEGSITGLPVVGEDPWTVPIDMPAAGVRILKDADGLLRGEPVLRDSTLTWTYTVINTGGQPLLDVDVLDDQGVVVSCPATVLAIGDSMTCTGTGPVGSGAGYRNVGSVLALPAWRGPHVDDEDEWSTLLSTPDGPVGGGIPVTGSSTWMPVAGTAGAALLLLGGALLVVRASKRGRHARVLKP